MQSIRKLMVLLIVTASFLAMAAPALANSGTDFVCPVFNSNAAVGLKNPNAEPIGGGDFTIIPGANTGTPRGNHLNVPDHATNMDGAGSPPGIHAETGDTDYTAIWNGD